MMGEILYSKKTIAELRREMARIRKLGGRPVTNYFDQCNSYADPMETWLSEKSCVFRWIDHDINRIFFYSTDMDELAEELARTETGDSIDYITREKDFDDSAFIKAGYKRYMEYGRFVIKDKSQAGEKGKEMRAVLKGDEKIKKQLFENSYGEPAKISDAEEIDRNLREKFDPYEAHFYSLETLRENIKKGWVWVARENGKIIAANLFEIQGRKCYGAYFFNNGPIEVVTSLLAKTDAAISAYGVNYAYCWMNLGNKRILRYNMQYNGYVHDGTYNFIYVKS